MGRKEQFQTGNIYPVHFNLISSCPIQTYIIHQNITKLVSGMIHMILFDKKCSALCFRHDAINSLFADASHCCLWSIDLETQEYQNHTTKDKECWILR